MASMTGQQTITMNILPNISKSESNQAMKLGQSIEHRERKNFLQKSCGKWDRETNSRPLFGCKKCFA